MRRPMLLAAAALACAAATPALAQTSTPPAIGTPKPFQMPASETYTLSNGMQVTLVPYGDTPKAVISLRVYAGSLNEGSDPWLASITADMLKEGSAGRTSAAIATQAAGMGGDIATGSGNLSTNVGIDVLSEFTPQAVRLVADVARRPSFPAAEFDRVKTNWGRRLALFGSAPGPIAEFALARAYYGDHPYGRIAPTPQQLGGYTLDQVRQFHARNFGARRAHLYIAGQFDAAAVKAAVEQAFGDWAAGPERLSLPPSPKAGPQVILVDRPGAPQSTIRLAFPTVQAGQPGDIDMRVMNALLGGAFSSRITTNIREDKGYTYSPGSGISQNPGDARWTFQADVTSESTGASLREVFSEVRRLQGEAPGAEEAGGMRTYVSGLFVIQNATPASLIGTLANRDALGLPANWLDEYVPAVLAVTPQQMSAAAARSLPIDKATLVVVGDLKSVEPQLRALPELKDAQMTRVTVP